MAEQLLIVPASEHATPTPPLSEGRGHRLVVPIRFFYCLYHFLFRKGDSRCEQYEIEGYK